MVPDDLASFRIAAQLPDYKEGTPVRVMCQYTPFAPQVLVSRADSHWKIAFAVGYSCGFYSAQGVSHAELEFWIEDSDAD